MSLSTAGQNKCLFCRNSYLGIQAADCRGASASQDRPLKGKGKGRELQALEITLFQYRKGKERERERGVRVREREMRMRGSLGEVLGDQGTKLRGGRAQTSDPYTHPALDPLFRPI